jgi:hypothetical protein
MVEVKLFDVRDRGHDSAAFAMKLRPSDSQEEGIVERMGFRGGDDYFLVGTLKPSPNWITYDQFHWRNGDAGIPVDRTMFLVHGEIASRWDDLASGDVIDVSELPFDLPPIPDDE